MKNLRFIIPIFLTFAFFKGVSQNEDTLKCWSSGKLKWSDFKGKPMDKKQTPSRAICANRISLFPFRDTDTSRYTYKVKAVFNRYKSWTLDTTKYILAHEQLHFDIGELYARKLRKAIKVLSKKYEMADKYVQSVIDKLLAERTLRDDNYDHDTIHGLIKESQHEWAKKIYGELEQLKEYASTREDCNLASRK